MGKKNIGQADRSTSEGLSNPGRYSYGNTLYLRIAPGGSKQWVQRIAVTGKHHRRIREWPLWWHGMSEESQDLTPQLGMAADLDLMLGCWTAYERYFCPLLDGGWLDLRFRMLMPYPFGNHRIGQVLVNWYLQSCGWPSVTVPRGDYKVMYRRVMHQAVNGNLSEIAICQFRWLSSKLWSKNKL